MNGQNDKYDIAFFINLLCKNKSLFMFVIMLTTWEAKLLAISLGANKLIASC